MPVEKPFGQLNEGLRARRILVEACKHARKLGGDVVEELRAVLAAL